MKNNFKTYLPDKLIRRGRSALIGSLSFLGIAHHFMNFWELPASRMLLLSFVGFPLFTYLLFLLESKLKFSLHLISRKRLLLLSSIALLLSSLLTWMFYHTPVAYQTIHVAPILSEGQTIGILELKANSRIISLQQVALSNGWSEENGVYYATKNSKPFTIAFKTRVNRPITILFIESPDSGAVQIVKGSYTQLTELDNSNDGQSGIKLVSDFHGIPNWIFIPFIIMVDIVTFGMLAMLLLVIQELGQSYTFTNIAKNVDGFASHKRPLFLLMMIGTILHLMNAFSTPLFLGPDSSSFLSGSVHLLKYGNFNGVSMIRGPGTTFLFAPVMFVFGNNPWAIKILLHLFAMACIPVSYLLGWKFSTNHKVAFFSGLVAVLSPDLLFYSNYVMSDVPNIFVVLTFITLLITALERDKKRYLVSMMLVGSFAVLLRSENIVVLVVGLLILCSKTIWNWFKFGVNGARRLINIGIAFLLALIPILWWSGHNLQAYGFWGMSNYQGEVFYDGWVYYGDASHLTFSNPNSPAIQTLQSTIQKYPILITDKTGVPTGWEIYPALLSAGYSPNDAFKLMGSAAWDSILNNPALALKLLIMKYNSGLHPEITHNITYPLPGEAASKDILSSKFFTADPVSGIPATILFQRLINSWLRKFYPRLYFWVVFCVLTIFLSLFRLPWEHWIALTGITSAKIFIPLTIGIAFWRYTLSGWILAQIIAVSWIGIFLSGCAVLFRRSFIERLGK